MNKNKEYQEKINNLLLKELSPYCERIKPTPEMLKGVRKLARKLCATTKNSREFKGEFLNIKDTMEYRIGICFYEKFLFIPIKICSISKPKGENFSYTGNVYRVIKLLELTLNGIFYEEDLY